MTGLGGGGGGAQKVLMKKVREGVSHCAINNVLKM